MSGPNDITRLFRACEPSESLDPSDPRYVNCDDARGENVVELYARSLRRAERHEMKLFAGHRGIGKTSELKRLKRLLEDADPSFLAVYFDVSESLDVNDLDLPDLLVCVASQVQTQLKQAGIPGFKATSTYLQRVWDDIYGLLGSEVTLKGADVEAPFTALAVELRNRPNRRAELRSAIERHSTSLLGGVNDLLASARSGLTRAGRAGLVLIVDGLDKLVRRRVDDYTNTHDRLFIDRAEQLASLEAHTIYTVPISLIYSPRCADLEQSFGEHTPPVPVIKLRPNRDMPVAPDSVGMQTLRRILEKRCEHAQVDFVRAFDDVATVNYLCQMTGGHPRHLMMFMQAAMNTLDDLPITRGAVEKAVGNYKNSLVREIPDAAWTALREFGAPRADIPKDDLHQQLLFLLFVFEYMNGEPWYEVNPVIRTLPRFAPGD